MGEPGEPRITAETPMNALPWEANAHMPPKLTPAIITAAIAGFEAQKTRIDDQIAELRAMLPGGSAGTAAAPKPAMQKRRKISAAGRKAIAEAQRKRWAASKTAAELPASEAASKPKRKLSAAGRKAIIAATKKRWRLQKAAAKAQSTAARKAAPARKKAANKKTAVKAPTKAAKKGTPVKKAAAKKTVSAPAQAATEGGAQ